MGIPFYTATFTLFEYQAITVAAVLSGHAWLPSHDEMRLEYLEKIKKKGYGRTFHSLMNQQVEYVDDLVGWLNSQAEVTGAVKIQGHSQAWVDEFNLLRPKFLKFLENRLAGFGDSPREAEVR